MALTSQEHERVEAILRQFEQAIDGKPHLEGVYDLSWRGSLGERLLRAGRAQDVRYPIAMHPEIFNMCYPDGFAAQLRQRLEDGAAVLLPRLTDTDRNHVIRRLRGQGYWSAQEELLLARGFASEFGADAVVGPSTTADAPRPEFLVRVGDTMVPVEAKGLFDSDKVRQLNETIAGQGGGAWFSTDPSIGDPARLRAATARKLTARVEGSMVLVLTQYSPWPSPDESVPLIREMAVSPTAYDVPPEKHALALGFLYYPFMLGVWFNDGVLKRLGLDEGVREKARLAVRRSFWPRADGVFFDECMDEDQFDAMMARMLKR